MASTKDAEEKPTVEKAMTAFGRDFLKACQGNDMNGQITGSMLRFLEIDNVSPYHQVKARVILAAAKEENEPEENVAAAKHHIRKAEEAFQVAKGIYVHDPDDARHMEFLRKSIEDEKVALRGYQQAVFSDDDDESEVSGY